MSAPKRLIVSYDDGSQRELDFDKLDREMQSELAKLGLAPPPREIGSAKHYMVLQWKDGWQEVIGSDRDAVDLLRYFVIRRIEDRGRFAFEVGDEYPDLFVIRRLPMFLNRLLVVGNGSVKSYDLGTEVERYEGTFEAGGKREYIKYDRVDEKNPHEMSEGDDNLTETLSALGEELEKKGVSTHDLLQMDQSRRIDAYKEIAEGMGIRGHQKQADVYGFIELLVRKLGKECLRG